MRVPLLQKIKVLRHEASNSQFENNIENI